jgi:hypothetical protein
MAGGDDGVRSESPVSRLLFPLSRSPAVADMLAPPEMTQARINKTLIALVAAKHVVKTSNNVSGTAARSDARLTRLAGHRVPPRPGAASQHSVDRVRPASLCSVLLWRVTLCQCITWSSKLCCGGCARHRAARLSIKYRRWCRCARTQTRCAVTQTLRDAEEWWWS